LTDIQLAYDWVPAAMLDKTQRELLSPGCHGTYFDPTGRFAEQLANGVNPDQLPLLVEADESVVDQGDTAELSGNVKVTQGARLIGADVMRYDLDKQVASLLNSVTIRNPGLLIRGSRAEVSTTEYSAFFEDAMFVLHEAGLRGGADKIRQTSPTSIELRGGTFTSCEPGDNSWMLQGEKFAIDTASNKGEARNVQLKIGRVPVFYFPYLSFPVGDERQSGFLFPSLSYSDTAGLDFAQPYYLNLAPNYDLTVIPRYISKRGAMLELEARHLARSFSTLTDVAVLPNDRGGLDPDVERLINDGTLTEEQALPYKGESRWLGHLSQVGGTSDSAWQTLIDYTEVSDPDYFRDLGTTSFTAQSNTYLSQSLFAGYQYKNWRLSALAQDYQVLLYDVDDPYRRAPQINLNGGYQAGNFGLKMSHDLTRFDHADDQWRNGDTIIKGARLTTDYRVNWVNRRSWGFFVPEVGYQTLSYQLDEDTISEDADSAPTLAAGQGSIDMGLIFDNTGGRLLQTVEPRLYYLYRDFADHSELFNLTEDGQFVNFDTSERTFSYSQLYRDSRFAGHDRLDDANRLTIGLTSRWYSNESGREVFTASAGQIFYYDDRRVGIAAEVDTEDYSELAADIRFSLGEQTSIFASAIYDEENREFIRGSGGINFATENYRNMANLAYTYVKDRGQVTTNRGDVDQADLSFLTPLSKQWYLMGRGNYDFTNKQELETFLGFEYNNCCYRLRFLARRWLDSNIANLLDNEDALYDSGVFFEVQLKGLGSSGAQVDSILSDSIIGYREREKLLN
nr:LPS-assembly protein LptD [Cellvibrionaceae bacterium]